jgi:ubiquinone/menaquinone biosynthesis C-methylase UbiE
MSEEDLPYEQFAYEIEELWKAENMNARETERIRGLAELIPPDVRSICDIGCGNGLFLNYLASLNRFERLCGVDRSKAALKHVTTEKVNACIDRLPFADSEFHMATSLEVIEHLPFNIYEKSLEEIFRVAEKYVMISVPNNQDLEQSLVSCPRCPTQFNADYHMRSFDQRSLVSLCSKYGYKCINVVSIGRNIDYRGIDAMRGLFSQKRKAPFPWYAVCPACGYHGELSSQKSQTTESSGKLKNIIKRYWPKKYEGRWIAGLYERTS